MKVATLRTATFLAFCGAAQASISIQSFSAATNDRFANNMSFTGAAYDWSGVGRGNEDPSAWATMITPNVFLSATHFHPGDPGIGIGTVLTFFPGNDPSATPVTGVVAGGQQIGGTDLWIGHLASALPSSIASYGRVTVPLTTLNFGISGVAGAAAYMTGNSVTATGYGAVAATDQAVGTNVVEGFVPGLSAGPSTGDVLATVRNLPGDGVYGYTTTTYEAQLTLGDSGSPLMLISGGDLYLAGIAWAVGSTDIDPAAPVANRDVSFYTYTGNYEAGIQSYIGMHPVPEPSALALVASAALLVRRRHRARW